MEIVSVTIYLAFVLIIMLLNRLELDSLLIYLNAITFFSELSLFVYYIVSINGLHFVASLILILLAFFVLAVNYFWKKILFRNPYIVILFLSLLLAVVLIRIDENLLKIISISFLTIIFNIYNQGELFKK